MVQEINLSEMINWSLILLAVLISFKFYLCIFLILDFRYSSFWPLLCPWPWLLTLDPTFSFAQTLLVPLPHRNWAVGSDSNSPQPLKPVYFLGFCCVWSTEILPGFWTRLLQIFSLHFISHCYVLWILWDHLDQKFVVSNITARNELKKTLAAPKSMIQSRI